MKIKKTNDKTKISLTKEEWLNIGKHFKTAQTALTPPSFGVPSQGGGASAGNPTGGAGTANSAQQTQNQNIIADLQAQKKQFETQKANLTSKTQSLKEAYEKASQAAQVAQQAYQANTEGIKRVDQQIQLIDQSISKAGSPNTGNI